MVGIAVIGAGNWGRNLVRDFSALKGVELRYICDLSESVRRSMAALYPRSETTADMSIAINDPAVHAAVVAVDVPLHFSVAKSALAAGKHVYVEKPLASSSAQCRELVELAGKKGLKLMVGHLLEYHPAINYMKEMLLKGAVGRPMYLYSQRLNLGIVRKAENAWWSLAPHDISLACYLFGTDPVSVSATGQAYLQNDIEDVVFANLKYADGRMAHIHVSWLDPHKIRKVTLVGSQKMVVFDDMAAGEQIRIYDKGADVQQNVASYSEAITLRTGDILVPKIPSGEPLRVECQHFLDAIVNNTPVRSDGLDGLRVVRILEAGSESLRQGGQPISL